jgi:hypothetical protein
MTKTATATTRSVKATKTKAAAMINTALFPRNGGDTMDSCGIDTSMAAI